MTDKDLFDLLDNFNPTLTPDDRFIERLEQNLRVADTIRLTTDRVRRSSRRAAILSALAGFLAGVVATMCAPRLWELLLNLKNQIITQGGATIPDGVRVHSPGVDSASATVFTCILAASFALLTSLQTYRISANASLKK